jgi:Putative metal-binding motif
MRHRLALAIGCFVAGAPLAVSAQTQIKPRVMIMVDTSGSMLDDFASNNSTGGDNSTFYKDSLITRDVTSERNLTPYIGTEISPVTNQCIPTNTPPLTEIYSGSNSRMFAAKAAVTNVLNGSGDVEWGLMRYTGNQCTVRAHTFQTVPTLPDPIPEPPGRCVLNSDCLNGQTCDTAVHECRCAVVATDCTPFGGSWTCTGGHCKSTNNAACPNPWVRVNSGGGTTHCECNANADCGFSGACTGDGSCNCSNGALDTCSVFEFHSSCNLATRTCQANCNAGNCAGGCVGGACSCTTNAGCLGDFCQGNQCGRFQDFLPQQCAVNGDCETGQTCTGGKCTCTRDDDCRTAFGVAAVCSSGFCGIDLNFCIFGGYSETSTRDNQACGNHNVAIGSTYVGTCGTSQNTANSAPCNSKQVCYVNADCGSGNCVKIAATDPMGECFCGTGADCRNGDYTCTLNRCVYNQTCQSVGGAIVVDPASAGYSPNQILLFANGREDATAADPELRAEGLTPLAGAARTATAWYNAIKNYSLIAGTSANCLAGLDANPLCDPKILCRPYALVQITDGEDTCEPGDNTEGPTAAAAGFVDTTPTGARVANKVYVIGLAANATLQGILNATAKMGGTGAAAFANNQADIQKALADIVVSSVLVEKCNYIDDDCNNVTDEPFPDVNAVCANGAVGHCAANGKFKCSTDQLSETCGPVSCRNGAGTGLTKGAGNAMTLTGVTGFTAADVGQQITIVSSRLPVNRGTFTITATTVASVTFTIPGGAGVAETFPVGFEIYCTQQTTCRGNNAGGPLTQAGNSSTLAGVSGFTAADIGDAITISGATNPVNNGTFPITAQTGTTVTYTNTAGVAQAAGNITWAIGCRSPSCKRGTGANFQNKAGGNIDLVIPAGTVSFNANDTGKTITIRTAANAANVGNFTMTFVNATTARLANANGVVENTGSVSWNLYCANAESPGGCNNFDDDCNGIPDDCTEGVAGSCCQSTGCQPVETCNGLDDDCNGLVDDNPVDVGAACGNNVGDCSPGVVRCCNVDPSTNGGVCPSPGPTDKPYCVGGNPGYPKIADLCDGTDDNCDGVTNGVPPIPCYEDPTAMPSPFPAALDGHGICHAGTKPCTTAPLPAGNGGCPPGWPPGLTCPNPNPTFGACANAVGPHPDVCNGIDDDCNDDVDNSGLTADPWVGMACCPPGKNCNNTGGSTRCAPGMLICQAAGQVCTGGTFQTPEVCNGIDDDCDGVTDGMDIPGIGTICTANGALNAGACKATFVCTASKMNCTTATCAPDGTGCTASGQCATNEACTAFFAGSLKCEPLCDGALCPRGLACVQTGTIMPEVCNGVDDDCNNIVDDPDEVILNDPALMMPCDVPAPPNDKPPCAPGSPVCLNGTVQCQGAVTPLPNVCGQPATDCTGNPSVDCPPGSVCFQGMCLTMCGAGEFPCPGGFVCDKSQNLCIPDACAKANCPAGTNCVIDMNGMAMCTDPCANINCPSGFRCQNGACVDDTCLTFGCPAGEVCVGSPPACVGDPCADVMCDSTQYCTNGNCVPLCPATCMMGERCVDGMCQPDPCAGVHCSAGQVCAITNGVGMCVTNMCLGTQCGINQICCGGACNNDPCKFVHCPEGIVCAVDSTCNATCSAPPAPPKDQIVGAGGGGISCAVGGRGGDFTPWLLLLLLGLLARRRREVR